MQYEREARSKAVNHELCEAMLGTLDGRTVRCWVSVADSAWSLQLCFAAVSMIRESLHSAGHDLFCKSLGQGGQTKRRVEDSQLSLTCSIELAEQGLHSPKAETLCASGELQKREYEVAHVEKQVLQQVFTLTEVWMECPTAFGSNVASGHEA